MPDRAPNASRKQAVLHRTRCGDRGPSPQHIQSLQNAWVRNTVNTMSSDPWLDAWLPWVARHVGDDPILELGCGPGIDTEVLVNAGHHVIGIDLSDEAIRQARARVPQASFHCQDLRDDFPVPGRSVGVVLASLSLHYFAWDQTVRLVERIRKVLRPGGLLLSRFNSTRDHHFGAQGHPMIETNFYLVDGQPKRFFDQAAIEALFDQGWQRHSLREQVVDRYAQPKMLWELVVTRDDPAGALAADGART